MKFKTILMLFFALIVVVFSLQNSEVTQVSFLHWNLEMSRVLIILGSFSIGVLVGIIVSFKRTPNPPKKQKVLDKDEESTDFGDLG